MQRFASNVALVSIAFAASSAAQSDRAFIRDDVLGVLEWRSLGPSTFGGRIVDIAVDPTRRQTFYAAAGSGGLWKTVNGGITFEPIFDEQAVVSIGDIAIAPSDPNTIYVGTGEANNQRSSYWGDGIYKSTDAGETWSHVGLRGTDHIGRIVVDPKNPDRVFVAALGALYRANEERGLYRTLDGGKTWDCVKYVSEDVGFVDVVMHPTEPDTLFAASYERRRRAWDFSESGAGSAIWRSKNGGDTWKKVKGGLPSGDIGRIGLSICASQPEVMYTIIENRNPRPKKEKRDTSAPTDASASRSNRRRRDREAESGPGAYDLLELEFDQYADREEDEAPDVRRPLVGGEVYRSNDGGKTWKKRHDKPVAGSPHYYYGQIRVDPNNSERVVALGVNAWHTNDGGKTWKSNFQSRLHVDCHAVWIDPADSRHSLIGNDGGLAETWDSGKSWRYINQLPLGQFYEIGVDMRRPYTIYGGTQDNGSWAIPSRSTTQLPVGHADTIKVGGGDGFYVQVDPENPDIVYSESQFGGLNRANVRTGARSRIKPSSRRGSPKLRFNWNAPLAISKHAPQTIYFGSQHLHRSRNRGDDWEEISPDLSTNDPDKLDGDVPHCTITSIAESPHRADSLIVGTDDGNVWMTRNGGDRWIELTDRFDGVPPKLWVSRVAWSPSDKDTMYVSFTGYREDIREPFVFMTTDGGETFRSIVNDLPRSSVNVIREHPRKENILFVGHEFGVAISLDSGASWHPLGKKLPTQPVHDLLVHPREDDLVIGTHGRGIYVLDIASLADLDTDTLQQSFHACKPRDGFRRTRAYQSARYPGSSPWRADRATNAAKFAYYLRNDSDESVQITVYDATERVLFERRGDSDAGLHIVEWRNRPQRNRGGRRGAAAQRGSRRGGTANPAAGTYLVVIEHGERSAEFTFEVHPAPGEMSGMTTADEEVVESEADENDAGPVRH